MDTIFFKKMFYKVIPLKYLFIITSALHSKEKFLSLDMNIIRVYIHHVVNYLSKYLKIFIKFNKFNN